MPKKNTKNIQFSKEVHRFGYTHIHRWQLINFYFYIAMDQVQFSKAIENVYTLRIYLPAKIGVHCIFSWKIANIFYHLIYVGFNLVCKFIEIFEYLKLNNQMAYFSCFHSIEGNKNELCFL